MKTSFLYVQTPEGSMTLIGATMKDDGPGYVTIYGRDGKPMMRLPRQYVRESNAQETAERIRQDKLAANAWRN